MKFVWDSTVVNRGIIQLLFLAPALTLLSFLLYFANRSIDFSDESLYLYLTSNPSEEAALAGSWNWYLNVLHAALGGDLVVYRQATITITFVLAFLLARAFFRSEETLGSPDAIKFNSLLNAALVAGAAVFFYRYFLLTPGYNWLAFVGILISLTGAIKWLDQSKSPIWPVITLCGLGIATMGRPFSGVFIFVAMMMSEVIRNDLFKLKRNGKLFIGTLLA
jgi:hypothetical protein